MLEGQIVARKELLDRTKKSKNKFVRKKWPVRSGLQISHLLKFVRSTLKHARLQTRKLNCPSKDPGRNFGERLDDDVKMVKEVFWQTVRRLRGKRSQVAFSMKELSAIFLKDQNVILNRWREYFCDRLNPVDAIPTQIYEEHIEENNHITEADVHAVIKSLKT